MKYVFTVLCTLLLTGNVFASDLKPRQTFSSLPKSGQVKELVGRQADRTTPAMAAPKETAHQWIDLGLCDYVDDIATGYFSVTPVRFKVKVQKDEANEGFYRILDPWANYPYKEAIENDPYTPGSLGEGDSYYILIDASDPTYVRLLESPLGMDDGDGESSVISLTELVGEYVGYSPLTQADADKSAGRLVDNVISFPVIRSLAAIQNGYYYAANSSGAFALALPGGKLGIDYSIELSVEEIFCPDHALNYHITAKGDDNIPAVRYAVLETAPESVPDDFNEISTPCKINETVEVSVANLSARAVYALFVAYDDNGEVQSSSVLTLDRPDENNDKWVYYGKADMTEGLVSCVFPSLFSVQTYEVDIERRVDNSKILRIVNPYAGQWQGAGHYTIEHAHNHYIYINAEDDDNVYIEYSPIGVSIPDNGALAITSDYFDMVNEYGLDFLTMFDIYSGGHMKDNVLTFDHTGDIKILPALYGKWVYTNLHPNPDYDEQAAQDAYENWEDYDVPQYIAGEFKLDLNKAVSGVENIAADAVDVPCEYFNLQGMKINNPANGFFIVRQGNTITRKYIR